MESSMIVSQNPSAVQFSLASKRIYINQDVQPGCDGVHHLYIPAYELEILVCRASKTYVARAHMCPCGAVSTDRGKTWETTHWAMMPSVIREESVSTVSSVTMAPEATIAPVNPVAEKRLKLATVTSVAMLIAGFVMGIVLNFLLVGILATLASPHVWCWTKIRAPQWWAMSVRIARATPGFLAMLALTTIVSVDLMLGRMAMCLKIWLKELPELLANVLLKSIVLVLFGYLMLVELAEKAWDNRPWVLRSEAHAYALAIFVILTVILAGI